MLYREEGGRRRRDRDVRRVYRREGGRKRKEEVASE